MTEYYTVATRREDRNTWYCDGPGTAMAYYTIAFPNNYNIFDNTKTAQQAAQLMNLAYEQGRQSAQQEFRLALGL